MKKILSTRVLVKICVLTTILLVLIIYTISILYGAIQH